MLALRWRRQCQQWRQLSRSMQIALTCIYFSLHSISSIRALRSRFRTIFALRVRNCVQRYWMAPKKWNKTKWQNRMEHSRLAELRTSISSSRNESKWLSSSRWRRARCSIATIVTGEFISPLSLTHFKLKWINSHSPEVFEHNQHDVSPPPIVWCRHNPIQCAQNLFDKKKKNEFCEWKTKWFW